MSETPYKNAGHPKDKCETCRKQVGECKCTEPNHPMGCECTRCGPILSPWDILVSDKDWGALAFAASTKLWTERTKGKDPHNPDNWPSSEEILVAVGKAIREQVEKDAVKERGE